MAEPASVVEAYMAAWNAGDLEASLAYIDPEVEIDWSESRAPWAQNYYGRDGGSRLFHELRDGFESTQVEIHEYVVAGNRVAVRNTSHLRGRDGIEVVARSTVVFTVRDDQIVAIRLFQEHDDALAALGVSP